MTPTLITRETLGLEIQKALTKAMPRLHFLTYPLGDNDILIHTSLLGQDISYHAQMATPETPTEELASMLESARVVMEYNVQKVAESWDTFRHEWPPLTYGDALNAMTYGVEMRRKDWPLGKKTRLTTSSHIEVETYERGAAEPLATEPLAP